MSQVKAVEGSRMSSTTKNTLKCILVLAVIAVVCVTLLAVANRFLSVEVVLDRATSDMINSIAPTGVDNKKAFEDGYISMVDLSKGAFELKSLDDFNVKGSNKKIRALYKSVDTKGNIVYVVESEAKGRDAAIVMLVAYDSNDKISGIKVKSQAESYWAKIEAQKDLFDNFIGLSGSAIHPSQIAESTGATKTLTGITDAVNISYEFLIKLGKRQTALVFEEKNVAVAQNERGGRC